MPEPEIGVNSTDDILKELLAVAKNIQGLLTEKTEQEARVTQQISRTLHESDDPPEVADPTTAQATLNNIEAIVETVNDNNWPSDETIAKYKIRCAKHKSECEKMQVELDCFIAHLGIVGGDKDEMEKAESLRNGLFHPVQNLEKAYDATPDGRPGAMGKVGWSFSRLDDFLSYFSDSPHPKDAVYPDKFKQWFHLTRSGWRTIRDLVRDGKFDECLEFIHDVFFSELETAMGGVVEALTTFEEKSASECLSAQKIGDYETWCAEYIKCVFPLTNDIGEPGAWPEPDKSEHFGKRLAEHKILCNEMWLELDHLVSHYIIIGGDKAVINATNLLKKELLSHAQYFEQSFRDRPLDFRTKMSGAIQNLLHAAIRFQSSLYHQKHAFYFRKVKKWVTCLWIGAHRILSLLRRGKVSQCMSYVHNTFLSEFEQAMIGVTHGEQVKLGENSFKAVPEELKTFGKESLPKFLVDEMERDTTRYVNLTTIATFFSSVTATTLQFTYAETDSVPSNSLRGVVNLFWFLSLVFSVSSGVNSLLGLTWRKSSIFDSRVPPKLIRMWFEKAPMLFLIIAAVAFVIGLNLFAYLSLQPRYVSFATTILTGVHGVCLLVVTAWFIYQLKHDSIWAKWMGKFLLWIGGLRVWKWIGKAWKWIGKAWKWIGKAWKGMKDLEIWRWIRHPRQQYRVKKLHLQRNFFWAFWIDNRVARLNYDIDWDRDWPGPYLLSKLIRGLVYPIKTCWLMTKKANSDLSRTVRAHICVPSPTGRTGDVEMGENFRREEAEVPVETSSPDEKAKDVFRKSLQKVFSEADWVMSNIESWEYVIMASEEGKILGKILWGYPYLVERFDGLVRPALAEAREKIRREREEADQQDTATENDAIGSLIPEVASQDTDDTTPVPPQLSQTAPLDDETGRSSSDITQTDVRPDSQGQPVNNHPPTLDERALLTASGNSETLEPTSGDPIPMLDIEGGATSEALFPLEGLRIVQSKEESGE